LKVLIEIAVETENYILRENYLKAIINNVAWVESYET
jgi:hypothetical protein